MIQYSNVYKTTPDAAAIGEFFDRQYKIQDSNFSIEKSTFQPQSDSRISVVSYLVSPFVMHIQIRSSSKSINFLIN